MGPFALCLYPMGYRGHALEIGASDGEYLSNTIILERFSWSVLCIEPNATYYEKLKRRRKLTLNVACSDQNVDNQELLVYPRSEPVAGLGGLDPKFIERFCPEVGTPIVQKIDVRTLDWCLEHVQFPKLDALFLDVDGIELKILHGFDPIRWRTKFVCVEDPFNDPEQHTYFVDRGFERAERINVNTLWVRKTV